MLGIINLFLYHRCPQISIVSFGTIFDDKAIEFTTIGSFLSDQLRLVFS